MLIHIVCFKYKATTTDEQKREHLERLQGLARLPGVVELKAGADVVRSPRSYDTALVVTFADRAALEAYQPHPQHVPVARFGADLSEHILAVDFEE
jgi:hypothetical protein